MCCRLQAINGGVTQKCGIILECTSPAILRAVADPRDTPAMRQFYRFKQRHPDCVLLFRIGDFYETFDDDAVTLHRMLGLTLTRRAEGVPMAGVPHHQLEVYLRRLVGQGVRVAVCDQLEDAKQAKGIVARGVTRVVTPGTVVDESLLEDSSPVRIGAVVLGPGGEAGARAAAACAELSTGEFTIFECEGRAVGDELLRRGVRELLVSEAQRETAESVAGGISLTPRAGWEFRLEEAREALREQYGVATLAGFGLREDEPAVMAAGALVRYLRATQASDEVEGKARPSRPASALAHLKPPRRASPDEHCVLDAVSLRALEIERTMRGGARGMGGAGGEGTLLGVFLADGAGGFRTPMGRRLLREWVCAPSRRVEVVRARHDAVAALAGDRRLRDEIVEALEGVQDVARIAGRVALQRATPRDVSGLGRSLSRGEVLGARLEGTPALAGLRDRLASCGAEAAALAARIGRACVEDPPGHLREGGVFREGVDAELDEARLLRSDAGTWLASYQKRLSEEEGLSGAKVGYNRVFGYYIELSAARAAALSDRAAGLTRVQTLRNAERYTTPDLREFERKVTTAQARALERERELFEALLREIGDHLAGLDAFAGVVAEVDALAGLAAHAVKFGWVRPEVVDEPVLEITQGRHPVLERSLGERVVPNDASVGGRGGGGSLVLLTGPNMAGKSTYIRQTALLAVLALAGSFVPAEAARVGVVDRVFTRIGADDALHAGQSTFMVEMTETANILHHATERSLVVLDEVGRGTSTLDGLSLAWAIAEHLAREGGPRTLFATHYHELTGLADRLAGRVTNLHVGVREWGDQIVFLHRILPGRSDRSYGIHVARLAGVPREVTARASAILESLAVQQVDTRPSPRVPEAQLGLFTEFVAHPAVEELRRLELEAMTPMGAFDELRRLRGLVDGA